VLTLEDAVESRVLARRAARSTVACLWLRSTASLPNRRMPLPSDVTIGSNYGDTMMFCFFVKTQKHKKKGAPFYKYFIVDKQPNIDEIFT
jgi:hypothetical protein